MQMRPSTFSSIYEVRLDDVAIARAYTRDDAEAEIRIDARLTGYAEVRYNIVELGRPRPDPFDLLPDKLFIKAVWAWCHPVWDKGWHCGCPDHAHAANGNGLLTFSSVALAEAKLTH